MSWDTKEEVYTQMYPEVPEISCWTRRAGIQGRIGDDDNKRTTFSLAASKLLVSTFANATQRLSVSERRAVVDEVDISGLQGGKQLFYAESLEPLPRVGLVNFALTLPWMCFFAPVGTSLFILLFALPGACA